MAKATGFRFVINSLVIGATGLIKRRGRAHTDRALGQFFFFYAGIGRENTKKK